MTEPSPEFCEVIHSNGIEKPLDINRDGYYERFGGSGTGGLDGAGGLGVDGGEPKKPKCSTRKYICPCCGNTFRATKDINVMCMDCMEQFVKVEK